MSAEYEIDMSIDSIVPTASEIYSESEEVQEVQQLTLEQMMEHLPAMEPHDLMELMGAVNTILKKKWKSQGTKKKAVVEKVKKAAPKALKRNQAWLAYVQKYAMENGWESFTIRQETKDKETGEKVMEETERSASIANDADTPYVFKDAKTGAIITPAFIFEDTKKHLIYKEAMSLSAQWKWVNGSRPALKFRDESEEMEHWSDLFREFVTSYEDSESEPESSSSSSSSTPSSPVVRRLSAAEKAEERAEKERIAEEEKESKRQAREEKKEASRLKKEKEEQEKEARRLEREAKKAEKDEAEAKKKAEKAEKEAKKSPPAVVKRSPVPAAKAAIASSASSASSASTSSTSSTKTITPTPAKVSAPVPKAAVIKTVAKAPAPKQLKPKMTLNVPADGLVHDWTWEGVTYLVNSEMCVWEKGSDDEPGNWVGMIDLEKNIIDTTIPEPELED